MRSRRKEEAGEEIRSISEYQNRKGKDAQIGSANRCNKIKQMASMQYLRESMNKEEEEKKKKKKKKKLCYETNARIFRLREAWIVTKMEDVSRE